MPTHYQGTPSERKALNAFIKLHRAAEAVSSRINAHLSNYNLTVSQFGVLEAIFHLGPMQMGELGEKILKSSGNMTTVIDNLERQQFIERKRRQSDRRCIDIHLTMKGMDLVRSILPDHVRGVQEVMSAISEAEQDQLGELCKKLGKGSS